MIWSLVLAAVGVFGLWMSGRRNRWGWAVGLGAQVLWITYALATWQLGFLLSAAAYGWVYSKNFLRWSREAKAAEPIGEVTSVTQDEFGISVEGKIDLDKLPKLARGGFVVRSEDLR